MYWDTSCLGSSGLEMSRITDQEFKLSFSLVGERSSEWLDEATKVELADLPGSMVSWCILDYDRLWCITKYYIYIYIYLESHNPIFFWSNGLDHFFWSLRFSGLYEKMGLWLSKFIQFNAVPRRTLLLSLPEIRLKANPQRSSLSWPCPEKKLWYCQIHGVFPMLFLPWLNSAVGRDNQQQQVKLCGFAGNIFPRSPEKKIVSLRRQNQHGYIEFGVPPPTKKTIISRASIFISLNRFT